jgi:ABC-type sugar transport system ATPase subunit
MIRLERLRVRAGDFSLFIDELSVAAGEYVMILGPTASGKTVLLETVAGLRRPQGGRVWFGGRDVTTEPPERRGAGLVYQDYALFPHLTVARNIGFGLRSRRTAGAGGAGGEAGHPAGVEAPREAAGRRRRDEDRVRRLAELLGIDGLLGRYPEGLSGGEQQRVALARALAIEPEVLLLDEPLSALDGPTRLELQGELKRLHKELGGTVLHVTHDLDEAMALGDRVAVLMDGELRQVGPPQHVTRSPVDVKVARLVGMTNVLPVAAMSEEAVDSQTGKRRIRLENGQEILVEGVLPAWSPGGLFAVIRAEEIDLQPLDDTPGDEPSRSRELGDADGKNTLEGTIKAIQLQSVHATIEVEVPPLLSVHILRPDVQRMGLAVGSRVRLRIPSDAVHICLTGAQGVATASNR